MSPAAIGCRVVILRGWPSASKRAPIAASVASGHPSADEDETVTTAPSGMRRAASLAEMTFGVAIAVSDCQIDGSLRARARRGSCGDRDAQGLDSVLAGRGRSATPLNGVLKQTDRTRVQVLVIKFELLVAARRP